MFVMTVTDGLSKSLLIPLMTNCYLAFVTYHLSSDTLTNKNVVESCVCPQDSLVEREVTLFLFYLVQFLQCSTMFIITSGFGGNN